MEAKLNRGGESWSRCKLIKSFLMRTGLYVEWRVYSSMFI